ncbi:MAG: hypothetical protein RIC16_15000 [Rhodospirillales bacterium]
MAGVDPVSLAVTGLTTMSSLQQARAQAKARTTAVNTQRRQILARREIEERRAAEQLKEALAARRARFGAGGIGGVGGSADAVMRGLRASTGRGVADGRRLGDLSLGGGSLFDDRLGLAANLIDNLRPSVSLFDAAPRRRATVRTPIATI